jgi:hypothetical protein
LFPVLGLHGEFKWKPEATLRGEDVQKGENGIVMEVVVRGGDGEAGKGAVVVEVTSAEVVVVTYGTE